jgi:hypothetical protein
VTFHSGLSQQFISSTAAIPIAFTPKVGYDGKFGFYQ